MSLLSGGSDWPLYLSSVSQKWEHKYLFLQRSSLALGVRMRKAGHSGGKAGDCPCLRRNQVVTLVFSGPEEAVSLVGAEVAESGIHKGAGEGRGIVHVPG